jgi:heat shock protein HtpX
MWNQIKTVLLLGSLSGIVLAAGYFLGGQMGLTIALILAVAMNFGMFFFSHKMVLAMYHAEPANKSEYPKLYKFVHEIAHEMKLPMPKIYIVPTQTPNAFATGPSPKKAVVACTTGILTLLDDRELKGVLAHEMAHIQNRDMLVMTIASTLAAVISYLANFAQFAAIFGGGRDRDSGNMLAVLALAILTPIIAMILQLAISRSREFLADEKGAKAVKDSEGLASALQKLEAGCKARPMRGNSTTSSLFIVNPFTATGLQAFFSTHPRTQDRVAKLKAMKF